jgi:hypothetical protein
VCGRYCNASNAYICWRTSEPARRTDRDAYPAEFKMTVDDIVNAPEVPAIPPLLAKTRS